MVINTFLLRNPDLKIAGVIFSAPFFGLSENVGLNWFKKQFLLFAEPFMEVSY
jgi:alpha-beta hydrolase superfamily lysophospholipase